VAARPLDSALRIDWLDSGDLPDGLPGRVGLTFLPGKSGASLRYPGRVYRRDLAQDLTTLSDAGVGRLLLLVEDGELARWGDPRIVERGGEAGVVVERRPFPDGSPPGSLADMDAMLDVLAAARATTNVAIACMGGVGRTGTVAACALVVAGLTADAAIARVRAVRHPTAVETDAQVAFVRDYESHVAGRRT